jgi:hypothetical protein
MEAVARVDILLVLYDATRELRRPAKKMYSFAVFPFKPVSAIVLRSVTMRPAASQL